MERTADYSRLRQLLARIEGGDVMIRIRSSGEEWSGFAQVLLLSENAMILHENGSRRIVMNLRNITEFEVDRAYLGFEPNVWYRVEEG